MKYQLTAVKQQNNTQISLDNIISGKTRHLIGYGAGVTFTGKTLNWQHDASFSTSRLLEYSDPSFVTTIIL